MSDSLSHKVTMLSGVVGFGSELHVKAMDGQQISTKAMRNFMGLLRSSSEFFVIRYLLRIICTPGQQPNARVEISTADRLP